MKYSNFLATYALDRLEFGDTTKVKIEKNPVIIRNITMQMLEKDDKENKNRNEKKT